MNFKFSIHSKSRFVSLSLSKTLGGLLACFCFLLSSSFVSPAQSIERKIIIQNGKYYYTTIDPEFQMATLHTGNYADPLKTEIKLALPAGRNYNDPVVPFAWDLFNTSFYAINFLNHPLNDRNEAIKKFDAGTLTEWSDKVTVQDMLMKSIDNNMFTYNLPYMSLLNKTNTLNNFYYDAVAMNDTAYYMAIANNGEFSLWNYNGVCWKQGKVHSLPLSGYFTLLASKKQLFLFLNDGSAKQLTMNEMITANDKSVKTTLSNGFFVMNKDENTIKFMKNDQLNQEKPLSELVKKKAITIF